MTTYTLVLPDQRTSTLNDKRHAVERHGDTSAWRDATWWLARSKINSGAWPKMRRVDICLVYIPPDRHRRDPDNLAPLLKACTDGLVGAGVIPDDNAEHVRHAVCHIAEPRRVCPDRWRLAVTELTSTGA